MIPIRLMVLDSSNDDVNVTKPPHQVGVFLLILQLCYIRMYISLV